MSEVIQELEQQLRNSKEARKRLDALERLHKNADFRTFITVEFMEKESARYAHLSAHPEFNQMQRDDAIRFAQAGGILKRWLEVQKQMLSTMAGQTAELEEALNEEMAAIQQEADLFAHANQANSVKDITE